MCFEYHITPKQIEEGKRVWKEETGREFSDSEMEEIIRNMRGYMRVCLKVARRLKSEGVKIEPLFTKE